MTTPTPAQADEKAIRKAADEMRERMQAARFGHTSVTTAQLAEWRGLLSRLAALRPEGEAVAARDYAGCIEPHDDVERTIAIVRSAYDWQVSTDGILCGLVAGDMGYASTHIRLKLDELPTASPPAPAGVKVGDWLAVAKAAGEHGVRYRTNRALQAFLTDIRSALLPPSPEAQAGSAKDNELAEAKAALDGIYTYCNDTLSGRADGGPDDRAWQREAVIHARNLARPFARPEIEAAIRREKGTPDV